MQIGDTFKNGKSKSILKNFDLKQILVFLSPALAILFAFFVAGLVVLISGEDPILAYATLFKGAFGTLAGVKNTIRFTLPIILLAFSFSICHCCGYFNIGQDGQLVAAALAVTWIPTLLPEVSPTIQIAIMILAGALVAGIVSLIPAIFKVWLSIDEVIIAILMNYIILLLSSYVLLNSEIGDTNAGVLMSIAIKPTISPVFLIVAVVIIIIGYSLSMQKTVPGFQLRMVGKNSRFAQISGIKSTKIIFFAALLGGALSGLVATGELLGVYHLMYDGFATGMGFNGIIASLIGQHSPIGMLLSSLVLGSLQSGSVLLPVKTDVPAEIVQVVQGFVMLFATINFVAVLIKTHKRKGI